MTVTVAAFDFDETLTKHDSVVPFLRRFSSRRRFAANLFPHTLRVVPMAARRDRNALRALATQLIFAGRPVSEVKAAAAAHGSAILTSGLRVDTERRLRWHLDAAHRVVIVSASYEFYLDVVAAGLGDVDVLATRLEVADGVCTGLLDGPNCRGQEKVERLKAWLSAQGLERSEVTLYAYGDSRGDHEMLAWADHPHVVKTPLDSVAPTV